jgi:hypothetical protein
LEELPEVDSATAEAKKARRFTEGKTDLVRKEPIEDRKEVLWSGIGIDSGLGMGTEDSSRISSSPAQSPKNLQHLRTLC